MTVRLMSDGELGRLEGLRDLDQRRLTSEAAAQLLGLERRQVFRLLKGYGIDGPTGLLVDTKRAAPLNLTSAFRRQCGERQNQPAAIGY